MKNHKKLENFVHKFDGVRLVKNGLMGGIVTISLEESYYECYDFLEKLQEKFDDGKYWFEPYSSCEIVVGIE